MQQLPATQSPHSDPSDGHVEGPQNPAMQTSEQHSSALWQNEPSGRHWSTHTPFSQVLLQQSSKAPHMLPSGRQAATHTPPAQLPSQQSAPTWHMAPSGAQTPQSTPQVASAFATHAASQLPLQQNGSAAQTAATQGSQFGSSATPCSHSPCAHGWSVTQRPFAPQSPLQHSASDPHMAPLGVHPPHSGQNCCASSTQMPSQKAWQQNGSNAQIVSAQSLHAGLSGSPSTQGEWLHVAEPQKPPSQTPAQHSAPPMQGVPLGAHGLVQNPLSPQKPEQHCSSKPQGWSFGLQAPPQTPRSQTPLQHSFALEHNTPFGEQPSQIPELHCPVQHCPAKSHSKPEGRQAGAHDPPTQLLEQHCEATSHVSPSSKQALMQTFPAQTSEQHCPSREHAEPSSPQVPRHTPFGPHTALQQSAPPVHGAPVCPHSAHTPSSQLPEQQTPSLSQSSPSPKQLELPQRPSSHTPEQHRLASWHGRPSSWHVGLPPEPPPPASVG